LPGRGARQQERSENQRRVQRGAEAEKFHVRRSPC
jgi:hypothetical protein